MNIIEIDDQDLDMLHAMVISALERGTACVEMDVTKEEKLAEIKKILKQLRDIPMREIQ